MSNELKHWGVKGQKWGVRRFQDKSGRLTDAGKKRYSKEVHEDYKKVHDGKKVKYMSDAELRARNNRLQMEKQYQDLTRKKSKGKQVVDTYVKTAGTVAAVAGATITYKKYGTKAVNAIGNYLMKELGKAF